MQFDAKLKLETEITSDQITFLFEKDGALRTLFNREKRVIEKDFLEGMREVQYFLDENASVRVFENAEVKYAYEVALKMVIIIEAEKKLFENGKANLESIIKEKVFNKEFAELATIEAYLLLLKNEVYNGSYVNVRQAMQKLEELKKKILNCIK